MNYVTQQNELRSLHRLLTRIRSQAYLGLPTNEIGRLLDDAEYLTTLIISGEQNDEYRRLLGEIETRYAGFEGLLTTYDAGIKDGIATAINPPAVAVAE